MAVGGEEMMEDGEGRGLEVDAADSASPVGREDAMADDERVEDAGKGTSAMSEGRESGTSGIGARILSAIGNALA